MLYNDLSLSLYIYIYIYTHTLYIYIYIYMYTHLGPPICTPRKSRRGDEVLGDSGFRSYTERPLRGHPSFDFCWDWFRNFGNLRNAFVPPQNWTLSQVSGSTARKSCRLHGFLTLPWERFAPLRLCATRASKRHAQTTKLAVKQQGDKPFHQLKALFIIA